MIKEIIRGTGRGEADVHLVKLINDFSDSEALTVDPHQRLHEGRVYFKYFNPNNHELDGKI